MSMDALFRPIVEDLGLTMLQARILIEVQAAGRITVGELGETIGSGSGNASTMCKGWSSSAAFAGKRAASDERVVYVSLTPEGESILAAMDSEVTRRYAKVLANWPAEDFAAVHGHTEDQRNPRCPARQSQHKRRLIVMEEKPSPRKPLIAYYIGSLILILLLNALVYPLLVRSRITEVDYSTFLRLVEEGRVRTVQLDSSGQEIMFSAVDSAGTEQVFVTGAMPDPELVHRLPSQPEPCELLESDAAASLPTSQPAGELDRAYPHFRRFRPAVL